MDGREPCGSLSFTYRGRKLKLKLYDALEWAQKPNAVGAVEGKFRLQQGRSWLCPSGQKYGFYTLDGCLGLIRQFMGREPGQDDLAIPGPDLHPGQRVRWMRSNYPAGEKRDILTWTITPPFQAVDGSWRIFLRGASAGLVPFDSVPCDEIQPL